jgi:centromere protein I
VDEISEHAYQFGLPNDELQRLVQLATTRNELDQSSVTTLIKNLYPADQVRSDLVVLVVNCLGQAKRNPSASTQAALVRWLIAIHDVLDDQSSVSRCYSVLFSLLDMITIRYGRGSLLPFLHSNAHSPILCQLLSVITRRKHVRPFRIQRL